jgi:hypothetical protein
MRIALLAALLVGCSSPSSPPADPPPDGAPDDAEAASPISAWPLASPTDALTGIRALARTPSNDWIVAGSQSPKTSTAKGISDAWFARTGADGATKQTRTWSNEAYSVVNAVAVSADGSIFACGSSQTADGRMDAWVQKRTADLELVWTRTLDGDAHFADSGIGLALDDAGNVAVVGFTDRNGSAVSSSVLIWKLDRDGATVYRVAFPDDEGKPAYGWSVVSDTKGGLLVSGNSSNTLGKAFVWKLDAFGARQWTRRYDVGDVIGLLPSPDGGLVLCHEWGLLGADAAGAQRWSTTKLDGPWSTFALMQCATDSSGRIAVLADTSFGGGFGGRSFMVLLDAKGTQLQSIELVTKDDGRLSPRAIAAGADGAFYLGISGAEQRPILARVAVPE